MNNARTVMQQPLTEIQDTSVNSGIPVLSDGKEILIIKLNNYFNAEVV